MYTMGEVCRDREWCTGLPIHCGVNICVLYI